MNISNRREAHLQMAVRAAKVGLWEWDLRTNAVKFSDEWKRQLGYSAEEIPNEFSAWETRVHPEDLPRVKQRLADYFAKQDPAYEVEFRLRHRDGSWRWILAQGDVFNDKDGKQTHMVGSHIDITELKRGEAERLAHLRFFESMDQVNRAILRATNPEEMMSNVLETLLAIFGCDRAWLVYPCDPAAPTWRVPMERTRPEYPGGFAHGGDFPMDEGIARVMTKVRETNGVIRFRPGIDYPMMPVAQDYQIRSVMAVALYPKADEPYMFGLHQCSHAREWTAEEEHVFRAIGRRLTDSLTSLIASRNLQQSQQAYVSLVNSIDGIVWEFDVSASRFTLVSPQAERLLGYPVECWLKDPHFWRDQLHPEDRDRVIEICQRATTEMRDHDFSYRMRTADGRLVWLQDLVKVVVENERTAKLRGITVDITKAKRVEEALQLFRALVDRATDSIEVVDPDTGRFLDVNERACQVHGYSREEYLRMHVPDLEVGIDFSVPGRWEAQVNLVREAGYKAFVGTHRRKDGSTFPVEVNANYISLDRHYVISVVRDVSERNCAEEALRESEQRFRQVAESIEEVFWLVDVTHDRTIYISPAYEKIWGRSRKGLYESPQSWIESIHPEDRLRASAARSRLQFAGEYDMEYRIERPDGAVRWIHDRAFPIRDAHGRVYRMVGVAEDITARRQLEDQVRQSQKMEAIGRLAGGIAHDFNNVLSAIQMQSALLLDTVPEEGSVREGIRDIMTAVDRAAHLTRQLLTFSRRSVKQTRELDLGEIVNSMSKLLLRMLGEDIHMESRCAPELPLVNADPGMMEQVLMNLAVNARDAMPAGGRLTVALETVEIDAENAAVKPGMAPGHFICLAVSDTGSGIATENLSRIFEPFFTTKEIGRGTGLGLAIVFGIVEQHHGWIDVESKAGVGTTFRIYLPASAAIAPRKAPARPITSVRGGSETILLVEDEPMVRTLTRNVLQRFGYRVIDAESAAVALEKWEDPATQVDLLLTDLVMPGMSGRELANVLIARQPSLPVLYCSGYSADAVDHQLPLGRGRKFLPKPCSASDLAAHVRSCLDEMMSESRAQAV
ncbi:MAG TPA: PAS domain S-box protein [Chthoniobacter sp.]|nr:PAS domain S-box protein [Chthoniobacter sp.]